MSRYRKVAVGGTFDKFHKGHELLINTAFSMADFVLIGVTSDSFAGLKTHDIESCDVRISNIKNIVSKFDVEYEIKEIFDASGSADVDENLEAIVVSHETEKSAIKINNIRKQNKLKPLDIIIIEWVLADDGVPISSTRIRKGEIDQDGTIL